MPIYEYECNACGGKHEFIQKFSEGPKRKCPDCGANRLRKLVSAAAFHLKGEGWYVTDFRDKDKKKKADGDKPAAATAESSESSTKSKSDSSSDTGSKDTSGKKKNGGDKKAAAK